MKVFDPLMENYSINGKLFNFFLEQHRGSWFLNRFYIEGQ